MRYAMVIDLDKCIGCQTCAVVCKMHHAQPQGTWWNRVFTQGSEYHQSAVGSEDGYKIEYLPVSCQMCDNAPCERVCPTGATYKNEEGMILVDYNRCIGCRTCMAACPYGVRQFNWKNPKKEKESMGYEYGYPFDVKEEPNRLVYTQNRPTGVVESKLIKTRQVFRLKEEYGTEPKVYYLSSVKTKNSKDSWGEMKPEMAATVN